MALPPLATVEDLAEWIGRDIPDTGRAGRILNAASTLIRSHTGRVWIDANSNTEENTDPVKLDAVSIVCLTVSQRVYENPRGVITEALGEASDTVAGWAALGLALTEDEKAMIGGSGTDIPGLSSIRVVAPAAAAGVTRTSWCDDDDEDTGS